MFPALVSLPALTARAALLVSTLAAPTAPVAAHARATEVARIRAHFDSVLTELPTHDIRALSPSQVARRQRLMVTLRDYRDAGQFPHNYDFPDQPTPYFVDRVTGVRCAVAHLIESTGRADIVARIAAADNNVWVASLASDTAVTGWLTSHGLTLDEAARIQIPYIGNDVSPDIGEAPRTGLNATAAVLLGSSLTTAALSTFGNSDGHRHLSSVVGLFASGLTLAMGATSAGDPSVARYVAPVSFVTGGVSALLSTRGLLRHRAYRHAQRVAATPSQVAVSPILPVPGVSGTGLAVRVRF
jgi:hypothetical protein